MSSQQQFLRGFRNAFFGWGVFFRTERNGRVQLAAGGAAVILSAVLHISAPEWLVVIGFTGLVLGLEMLNSAVEKLCDIVHPEPHPQIRIIKDMAAGAVLWASVCSAIAAAIIFIPKLIRLI